MVLNSIASYHKYSSSTNFMNLYKLLHQLENSSNFNLEFILSSVKGKDLHLSESNDITRVSIKLMKSSIFPIKHGVVCFISKQMEE